MLITKGLLFLCFFLLSVTAAFAAGVAVSVEDCIATPTYEQQAAKESTNP